MQVPLLLQPTFLPSLRTTNPECYCFPTSKTITETTPSKTQDVTLPSIWIPNSLTLFADIVTKQAEMNEVTTAPLSESSSTESSEESCSSPEMPSRTSKTQERKRTTKTQAISPSNSGSSSSEEVDGPSKTKFKQSKRMSQQQRTFLQSWLWQNLDNPTLSPQDREKFQKLGLTSKQITNWMNYARKKKVAAMVVAKNVKDFNL
mmetsp:Transcript_18762/g.26248  ORF Transcript_18762/g.26248 Transcript_18762/m.26248 type:complete len:204 (+) Transcript_18762:88-699(+)